MTPLQSVEKIVERHEGWLSALAKDVHNLELWRAKIVGVLIACSFFGSALGSLIAIAIVHYWK